MKGKIKILSLLLAVAMTVSMFVACTPEDEDKDPSSTPSVADDKDDEDDKEGDEPDPAPEMSTDPVTLTWYMWGDEQPKAESVEKVLNEKSLEDINVEIDFVWAGGAEESVKTVMSTGGDFDIAFSCGWWNNYALAAQAGYFLDISDEVKTYAPSLWDYVPEELWDGMKIDGKIFGVPIYKDAAGSQYWLANTDYVIDQADAGEEFKATSKSLSSVTPLLEKVKAFNDAGTPYPNDLTAPFNFNVAGLNGHENGWDFFLPDSLVGVKIEEGETVQYLIEEEEYVADLKVLADWNKNGLTNPGAKELDAEPNRLVVSTAQGWDGAELTSWEPKYTTPVSINMKSSPILTSASTQGGVQVISPNSEHVDRSLQYLEYINTNAEYRNTLAYGIEGVNWEEKEGVAYNLTGADYQPGAFSQATFFNLLPMDPAKADMWDNLKAVSEAAPASPLLGFTPNVAEFQTEVSACNAIGIDAKKVLLVGGTQDVDAYIAETIAKLDAAGGQVIIEGIQKQVDAFLASK